MEHSALVESAFANLLANLNPSPWATDLQNEDGLRIFAGENCLAMDGTTIVCYIDGEMGDEDPPTCGNRWADIIVRLRTPIIMDIQGDYLENHQANASALAAAISSATLPADVTAAIAGFTCFGITDRKPMREQTADYLMSGWRIHLISCPTAFAN